MYGRVMVLLYMIWKSYAPAKFMVFSWKLIQNRMLTEESSKAPNRVKA